MNEFQEKLSIQSAISALEHGWSAFESRLLSLVEHSGFSDFILGYRGIPEPESIERSRAAFSLLVTDAVRIWVEGAVRAGWNSSSSSDLDKCSSYLSACESAANVALYFWHAPHDRNLQFRAYVHFAGISPEPILISGNGGPDFFLRLTEWGVQIGITDEFEPFPQRFSLAKACGLSRSQWEKNIAEKEVSAVVADLRVMQREFCQMIDEWEHCNSILAVRQFGLRKLSISDQGQVQQIFSEISRTRDQLARWCARSAADFQSYVSYGLISDELHSDARAELVTTDALLLSGVQKLYLPASVSRHVYGEAVIQELLRFAAERLRSEPEDMYALLSGAAFSLPLGRNVNWNQIISTLEQKSFHWSLSADPSAAIKSVAWGYSPAEHQLLTALCILVLHLKREPDMLEVYWLHAIASVVEMPTTFNKARSHQQNLPVERETQSILCQKAINCLVHFNDDENEESKSAFQYIVEFLKSDFGSLSVD